MNIVKSSRCDVEFRWLRLMNGFNLFVYGAGIALSILAAHEQPAFSQERDSDWARQTASDAFFHVSVAGKLSGQRGTTSRSGKAFAIASDLVITSRHVIGSQSDWEPDKESGLPEEVEEVLNPILREIEIVRTDANDGEALGSPIKDLFVVEPEGTRADVVGIALTSSAVKKPFRISLCDLVKGKTYTAILTVDSPKTASSITKVMPVSLLAHGYKPTAFGDLYVFEPVAGTTYSADPEGHDGSPILDEKGEVVAVVSAVTKDANNQKWILGTPIGTSFPSALDLLSVVSAANDQQIRCSLAQAVAAQAFWTLDVSRDEDGRVNSIGLRYENLVEPNIIAIKIVAEYWGYESDVAEELTNIKRRDPAADQDIVLTRANARQREFTTDEIHRIGKDLIESNLEGSACILYVKLNIFPRISAPLPSDLADDSGYLKRPIIRKIPWNDKCGSG